MAEENKKFEPKNKEELKTAVQETRPGPVFIPQVDIFEDVNQVTLLADMPGVNNENISVDLEDDQLTIRGTVKEPENKDEIVISREYNWENYFRKFTIGNIIDREKITAAISDGVLRLVLPKAEETKPIKISVNVG
ncbi:MAG: Hsp20/alpha crystallin family protein [Thermodesulfobacteriota bacterium]|nr:Hsp20/alpha crystallin family protein [Thermodesulfobacteriota bacterium]